MNEALRSLCFSGRLQEAIRILYNSHKSPSDSQTYSLLLQESIHRRSYPLGARVHAHSILTGHVPSPFLRTKLLIFYSKLLPRPLPPSTAHHLFDETSLVAHNALISSSHPLLSLHLFHSLRLLSSARPDRFTFASVLRSCARLAKLDHGRRAHALLLKSHPPTNLVLSTALVDMYSKCSCLPDARRAFDHSVHRNVVTWSALVSAYGHHGCPLEALALFARMACEGFAPNSVTLLAVLSACSHGGLVDAGLHYFRSMKTAFNVTPRGEHYAAVVDMLGRAGRLAEAYDFVRATRCERYSAVWGALLGACRVHRDGEMGRLAAERLFEMQPRNVGKYVVLANTYAALGMWEKVADVRETVGALGMSKEPAWSSVVVRGEAHTFLVGDKSHGESEMIYETVDALSCALLETDHHGNGYQPASMTST